jgi:hypothetical protein
MAVAEQQLPGSQLPLQHNLVAVILNLHQSIFLVAVVVVLTLAAPPELVVMVEVAQDL